MKVIIYIFLIILQATALSNTSIFPTYESFYVVISLISIFLLFKIPKSLISEFKLVSKFIILIIVFFFLHSFYYNYFHYFIVFSLLIQTILGFKLLIIDNRMFFGFSLIVLLIYIIYLIIISADMNTTLTSSRNTFSVIAILNFIMYYLCIYNSGNKLSSKGLEIIFFSIITFIICVLAIGRSGIISSGIILILSVLSYTRKSSGILTIISMLLLILVAVFNIEFIEGLIYQSRFGTNRMETLRTFIYLSYLSSLDFSQIIFGGFEFDYNMNLWDGGIHNSFLLLHLETGLGVLVVLYFVFYSLVKFIIRGELILAACSLAILTRAFTDTFIIRGGYICFAIIITLFIISKNLDRNKFKLNRIK